jgi:hypothetical protein
MPAQARPAVDLWCDGKYHIVFSGSRYDAHGKPYYPDKRRKYGYDLVVGDKLTDPNHFRGWHSALVEGWQYKRLPDGLFRRDADLNRLYRGRVCVEVGFDDGYASGFDSDFVKEWSPPGRPPNWTPSPVPLPRPRAATEEKCHG